jgi:Type IX secretion system protein PorV
MRRIIFLVAVALLIRPALPGQTKTGTTVGQFTIIEPSARSSAMGGAGVTSSAEAMAAYYNPAALGSMVQSDLQFTHNFWFGDIVLDQALAAFHLGERSTVGLAVTHLSSGDIDVTTVEHPLGTGERYSVTDLLLGAGFGMMITDRFSCGIQVNYATERIWHSSIGLFSVNLGTLYRLSEDGLRIGASLVNFGTKSAFDGTDLRVRYDLDASRYGDNGSLPAELLTDQFSLPIIFRVGAGYPWHIDGSNVVDLAVDAINPSDNSPAINIGAEWFFRRVFALRAGYAGLFQTDSEFGLTAGAGVIWDGLGYDLRLDYSWAGHRRLGAVQRITVGFAF